MTDIDREALVSFTGATLDGEPARIGGARLDFPRVVELRSGKSVEFAWATVARIVASGGRFRS